MPYIPPSLKKATQPSLNLQDEQSFPSLGGNTATKKFVGNSFASKANEWAEQLRENDFKQQLEAERKEREELEMAVLMKSFPQKKEPVKPLKKIEEFNEEVVKSEWTEITQKARKTQETNEFSN
jgi:hypothetical protein